MYRMFIIGAGFSKYAGLPLGHELWALVLSDIHRKNLYHLIENDLDAYIEHKSKVYGHALKVENIELEDFISYLDIEHYLGLKGSDTFSSIGNKTQILLKNSIAKVLFEAQENMPQEALDFYDRFCSSLHETDMLISFNYDTIIEEALKRINKPFRLFPKRMKAVYEHSGEVDDVKEVVLLKVHGSINWFDNSHHNEIFKVKEKAGSRTPSQTGTIFSDPEFFQPKRLLEGPYFDNSLLNNIYTVDDLSKYFERKNSLLDVPLIISPSHFKFAYLTTMKEFWWSFNHAGTTNRSLNIIGFSFPEHDKYIMQPLTNMVINFQDYSIIEELGHEKEHLKVIDFHRDAEQKQQFQDRLRFINWNETHLHSDGFNEKTLESLFN